MCTAKKSVVIEAGIRVKDAKKFLEFAADVVKQTRKEAGCVRYDLFQDVYDPNTFYFIEEYVDEAAFHTHRTMPYMEPFRKNRETVLDKFLGVRKLSDI